MTSKRSQGLRTPGRGGQLVRNMFYFATGGMITRLVAIGLVPFYARSLGPSGYGEVEVIVSAVGLLYPILSLSLYEGVLRFVMKQDTDNRAILSTAVAMAGLATTLGSVFIALAGHGLASFSEYVGFVIVLLLCQIAQGIAAQFVRASGDVRGFVLGGIVEAVTVATVAVLALYGLHMGLAGYVIALATGSLVSFSFLSIRVKIWRSFDAREVSWTTVRLLGAFCYPLILNGALWWVINSVNRLFIAANQGMVEVGVFGVAHKVSGVLTAAILVFGQAWQMSANEEYDSEHFTLYASRVFNVFHLCVFGGALALGAVALPLLGPIFGSDYGGAMQMIPPLLIAASLSGSAAFLSALQMARMRTVSLLWTSLVAGAVVVTGNALLVPAAGGLGASLAATSGFLALVAARLLSMPDIVSASSILRWSFALFMSCIAALPSIFGMGLPVSVGSLCLGFLLVVILYRREVGALVRKMGVFSLGAK